MTNKKKVILILSEIIQVAFTLLAIIFIESSYVNLGCLLIVAVVNSFIWCKYPVEHTWRTYALLGVTLVVMFLLGIKEVSMYLLMPVGIILLTLVCIADYNDRVREEK